MRNVGGHLVTFLATLSVCLAVLFCYRWMTADARAPDGGVQAALLAMLVASLLTMVAVGIAVDQPWRRLPDSRRDDWPFYVLAGAGVVVGLLIMLVLPWVMPAWNHWSVSMIGQLLTTFSCYLAVIPGHKRRKRRSAGCCPECGYDLRASPQRCPECGTPTS